MRPREGQFCSDVSSDRRFLPLGVSPGGARIGAKAVKGGQIWTPDPSSGAMSGPKKVGKKKALIEQNRGLS